MANLVLDLPTDILIRLQENAERAGISTQTLASDWIKDKLASEDIMHGDEQERVISVLRAAGLLTDLSSEEKERAGRSNVSLDAVRDALDRVGGQPLSDVILEMRNPKG